MRSASNSSMTPTYRSAGRAGRSRDRGPHRVSRRRRPGRWLEATRANQDRQGDGRRESARSPLETIFDDRSKNRRVTGPIEFAIDGKALTAWTFDIGPGRRNQPRKAVFVAEKPIGYPGGPRSRST